MKHKLTHKELVDAFSEKTGQSKVFSRAFIQDVFAIIEDGLEKDEIVRIKGLGIFKIKDVPEREMINPQTGEKFIKEAHHKVVFKPEKSLRDLVNKKYAHLKAKRLKRKSEVGSEKPEEDMIPSTTAVPEKLSAPAPESVHGQAPAEQAEMPFPETTYPKPGTWKWMFPLILVVIIAALFITTNRIHHENLRSFDENAEIFRLYEETEDVIIHIIEPGNTISGLAKQYYGRPALWPTIYRKNADKLKDPDQLFLGQELLIPKLDGQPFVLTQNDSACVAHGYYLVSKIYKQDNRKEAKAYLELGKKFLE